MKNHIERCLPILSLLCLVFAGCGSEGGDDSTTTPPDQGDVVVTSDGDAPDEEVEQEGDAKEGSGDASQEVAPDGGSTPEPDAGPSEPLTYPHAEEGASMVIPAEAAFVAPELNGGLAWLNTPEPLRFDDQLAGHVVLLDFWTYGCVNCLHIIPVLQELEEMYADYPFIVIGIHSGKFATESEAQSIAAAIQHYDIHHPVLVDDAYALWNAYNVKGWPTVGLIDAQGRIRFSTFGEFLPELVIPPLDYLLQEAFETGVSADAPLDLYVDPNADADTPLLFPGKVLALPDGRVAIADSGHHRVVIATADGEIDDLVGAGIQGHVDGLFANAAFQRPQGMAWLNGLLYIADTENHLIREVDLEERTVVTVAGTGDKGVDWYSVTNSWQDAMTTALRSPWDLEVINGDRFAVAMAGSHQLWVFEPDESRVRVLSGKKYSEGLVDGIAQFAQLAQPSGLSLSHDGETLYFADSESSAIRTASVSDGSVDTLVGTGLFNYGDLDGVGSQVLLQHALGVEVLADGNLIVADTYNDKLKHLNVETTEVSTLDWGVPDPGLAEPRGLSRTGDVMYITDTNNHRVLKHNLDSGETVVFHMPDLEPPALSGFVADDSSP